MTLNQLKTDDKGKLVERRGRKAMGLRLRLGLPGCHDPFGKIEGSFLWLYGKGPSFFELKEM